MFSDEKPLCFSFCKNTFRSKSALSLVSFDFGSPISEVVYGCTVFDVFLFIALFSRRSVAGAARGVLDVAGDAGHTEVQHPQGVRRQPPSARCAHMVRPLSIPSWLVGGVGSLGKWLKCACSALVPPTYTYLLMLLMLPASG